MFPLCFVFTLHEVDVFVSGNGLPRNRFAVLGPILALVAAASIILPRSSPYLDPVSLGPITDSAHICENLAAA